MTEDKTFERIARTWLEQGPAVAPQRAIDAALISIETTPQQRTLRVPRRFLSMFTPLRLAAAATIVAVVLGGGFLLFGRTPSLGNPIASPSPSPSASASATISATPSPSLIAASDVPGQWLVFELPVTPGASPQNMSPLTTRLWAVRQDGTELHEVAPTLPNSQSPALSPDGSKIAFESTADLGPTEGVSRVWFGPIDGRPSGLLWVDCDPGPAACEQFNPAFSPDGTQLAFVEHDTESDDYVVLSYDIASNSVSSFESTRGSQRQAENGNAARLGRPTWSPNGEQIAYQRTLFQDDVAIESQIWVVNTNDTNNHQLPTPAGSTYADPDWSPDGSLILLSNDSDRYDPFFLGMGIYTITPDTSVLSELCRGRDCGANPSWTADGSQILAWAMNSARGATWALMDAAGSEMVPINPDLDVYTTDAQGGFVVRLQPATTR